VKIQAIRKEEGSHSFWCDRPGAGNKSRVGKREERGGEVMPPPRQEHMLGKGGDLHGATLDNRTAETAWYHRKCASRRVPWRLYTVKTRTYRFEHRPAACSHVILSWQRAASTGHGTGTCRHFAQCTSSVPSVPLHPQYVGHRAFIAATTMRAVGFASGSPRHASPHRGHFCVLGSTGAQLEQHRWPAATKGKQSRNDTHSAHFGA